MKVVNVKNVAIGEGITKICVPLVAPTDYDVDYQTRIIFFSSSRPRDTRMETADVDM